MTVLNGHFFVGISIQCKKGVSILNYNEILNLKSGPELDAQVTIAMIDTTGEQAHLKPYSSDPLAALELREFIAEAIGTVGLAKHGGGPILISEYCRIADIEDESSFVEIETGSWMKSLCKAFLLFTNGIYGYHENPEYEIACVETNPH